MYNIALSKQLFCVKNGFDEEVGKYREGQRDIDSAQQMCQGTVGTCILALGYGYIAGIMLSTNLYHRLTVDLNHLMEPLQKLNKGEVEKVAHLSPIVSGFSTHFC